MNAHLYIEGAKAKDSNSRESQIRCREGFRKLLEKAGFKNMPRTTACGSRHSAFDRFKTAHAIKHSDTFVALLVDSEDPVNDIEKPWEHLKSRDNWTRPAGASDEQVFLMTTCMETWIVADRAALQSCYGHKLQTSALPPEHEPEKRDRQDVLKRLKKATENCAQSFEKGEHSFGLLSLLNPETLAKKLPSFARMIRILNDKL